MASQGLRDCRRSGANGEMDFMSAWIVSPSALPFLCLILGTHAQQAFRTEPRNLTVRMGATAVLRCEVLRASGTVQWVKDGLLLGPQRRLPGFERYSMIGNLKRGQHHLQIEKTLLEDEASYECQAGRSDSSQAIISSTAWIFMLSEHNHGSVNRGDVWAYEIVPGKGMVLEQCATLAVQDGEEEVVEKECADYRE
ncbi:kin of IRRE-like protein 2 [Notothenia coriiceps]|uniref:Kin of IRRE-like protein 2 n=1 Tax=Notothenia coriiceps TaxID=8208 RepID=A0A6I9PK79_9TELE|nr:PREDICTED: kin of IRRE-like protein 2 [Notothenia coriiceps]